MTTIEKEIIFLHWALLEFKCAYYYPNSIHESWKQFVNIPDQLYDYYENIWKKHTNKEMCVDFGTETGSGRLIVYKLSTPKLKNSGGLEVIQNLSIIKNYDKNN